MLIRTGLIIGLLGFLTPEAHAQSLADEADAHFNAAVRAYQAGRFEQALLHFMQSNRLSPNPTVAANVGHAYVALRRYAEAYRWYSIAYELATDDKTRQQLTRTMKSIENRVVLFDLRSEPEGATVYVDRRSLGAVATTPATIALPPGEYAFIFDLEDHRSVEIPKRAYERLGEHNLIEGELEVITGHLIVDGMEGVEVYDNVVEGDPLCVTPCEIDIPIGQHVLQLAKDGYRTQPALVSVEEGAEVRVEANPERVTGNVKIDATVDAALVLIDGEPAGFTPVIARAPIGERTIRVEAQGYEPAEFRVEVRDGSTIDLGTVKLQPRQIVTLASRVEEDIFTAPSSVSVITRAEMEAFGYPTVTEALRGVRGVTAINADEDSMVMVRGVGTAANRGTQTKALLNGVALTDQLAGRPYIYTRNQNIETIEVQRGSGSVLYGSGALTGLISLRTRGRVKEPFAHGSLGFFGSETRVNTAAGLGDEERGGWVSVGGVNGRGDQANLLYTRNADGDVVPATNPRVDRYSPWQGIYVDARGWEGDVEGWAQFARDRVIVTSTADGAVRESQAGLIPPESTVDQFTVGLNFRPQITANTKLDLSAHYRQVGTHKDGVWQRFSSATVLEQLTHQVSMARWVGLGAQVTTTPLEGLRIVSGAEFYGSLELSLFQAQKLWLGNGFQEAIATSSIEDGQIVVGAYGVADYQPIDLFKASVGLRFDQWRQQRLQLNPRLALMFLPTKNDVVKFMVGRAFRAPVTFEQDYFVESVSIPANDLLPEKGWSTELEYAHRLEAWTGLASVWFNRYQNVIRSELNQDVVLQQYTNTAGVSEATGFDLELRRDFLAGSMFSAWYSFQLPRVELPAVEGDALEKRDAPEQPKHLGALKIVTPIMRPGLNAAVRFVYEGKRKLSKTAQDVVGAPDGLVSDALLVDFVLSGKSRDGVVGWRAGVYNALNEDFQAATLNNTISPILPQTRGRTFMASLEFTGRRRATED